MDNSSNGLTCIMVMHFEDVNPGGGPGLTRGDRDEQHSHHLHVVSNQVRGGLGRRRRYPPHTRWKA